MVSIVFLDCEYNEHCGDLISIALVPLFGESFYEVLPCQNPTEWVSQNVIPILGKLHSSKKEVQARLSAYLHQFESVTIITDWPEDISHFCMLLITSNKGQCISHPPLNFKIQDIEYQSEIPHNALADAKAMRAAHAVWSA